MEYPHNLSLSMESNIKNPQSSQSSRDMQPGYFLISQHFQDVDDFSETARAWNLNIRQLERGRFLGKMLQYDAGNLQVGHAEFHPGNHQWGEPPQGLRTFGLLADSPSNLVWRGKRIRSNAMMAFPRGSELDAVSRGGRLGVFTLSFSEELLTELCQLAELPGLEELLVGADVVEAEHSEIQELRCFLYRICRKLKKCPSIQKDPSLRQELEFELPLKILKALSLSRTLKQRSSSRMRDRALKQIEDFLDAYPQEPHTVRDLCRIAQVSERTLQYTFLERFGISPKSYLLRLRLDGVRKELRKSDPSLTMISTVARYWGFWHMGQFATDYRKLFGELPSETLGKAV
jgi:AraC family ethanolamine operon transcriptional activator